jgi:hypothetical protein
MAQGNAPKELYQQGGPAMDAESPEAMMEQMMSEGANEPWVDGMMAPMPPPPAAGAQAQMIEGMGEVPGLAL